MSACNQQQALPPPPAAPSPVSDLPPYRIQPGDILGIRLLLNPDLNEDVVVRPDGHMSTMVVRDAPASGRTVPELTETLTHDYASAVRNPHLTVELKTYSPVRVYVGGEVANPVEFITAGMAPTLSQAIARAGGLKNGKMDTVSVIHRGPDDVPQFFSARLRDVMQAHDPAADIRLEPYDVVYVPRDGAADVHRFLEQDFAHLARLIWGFSYNTTTAATPSSPAR
jgi:polysaccharide export outer membrane protein